jgi:ankyrin repeat protein
MNQFFAAGRGDLQELRVVLTVDNVNAVDYGSFTALHCAVMDGYVDCVNYCIEMGAKVNAGNRMKSTRLCVASGNGHVNVVRVLLEAGATVDAKNSIGFTPLYRAICYKRVDVARLLIDWGARVYNVKLDEDMPAIPIWVTTILESRFDCRIAGIIIIGIHKYRRTSLTGNNDINVL